MSEELKPIYQQEYEEFMDSYKSGSVGAEAVGKIIAHFGQYFGDVNRAYAHAIKQYNKVVVQYEQSNDDVTGKPLSSVKATKMADASVEGEKWIDAKTEVEIVGKQIQTLQSLQKGIIAEFGSTGGME